MKKFFIVIVCLLTFVSIWASVSAEDAVIGSWKLGTVYETRDGGEPVERTREDSQSLYGTPESILTFNEDGSAYESMIEFGERYVNEANWKVNEEGLYVYYVSDLFELELTYDPETDTLHRYYPASSPDDYYGDLDFVYIRFVAEPITGSWTLETVIETRDGEEPIEHDRESSQSLYGSPESTYTFFEDGSAIDTMAEAGEPVVTYGKWEKTGDAVYLYTGDDSFEMELTYDPETDTLHRYLSGESTENTYGDLDFVYFRAE